ncbi:MAG TPA: hypothetical protein VIY90_16035 [Steroidobacteraceae bacterium]
MSRLGCARTGDQIIAVKAFLTDGRDDFHDSDPNGAPRVGYSTLRTIQTEDQVRRAAVIRTGTA